VPSRWNVFRSVCAPAPPVVSEPAMVRATWVMGAFLGGVVVGAARAGGRRVVPSGPSQRWGPGAPRAGILSGPSCPSPRSCRALPGSGALRTGPSQRPRPDPTASGTVPGVLTPDPTTQDSPASTAPAGTSVRSRLAATAKQHLRPTSLFLLVGGVVFLLDTAMYNLLVFWSPSRGWGAGLLHGTPLTAKLLTIAVASCLTYLGNRLLTFGDRPRPDTARSLMMFVLVNLIAAGLQLSCLAFSRYVLGLDSVLADNISGTLVGQVVSTSFRYVTYGRLVFPKR